MNTIHPNNFHDDDDDGDDRNGEDEEAHPDIDLGAEIFLPFKDLRRRIWGGTAPGGKGAGQMIIIELSSWCW